MNPQSGVHAGAGPTPERSSEGRWAETAEPVAVVGIGCRFPGGVTSPENLWEVMVQRRCTAEPVPQQRWASYRALSPDHETTVSQTIQYGSFLPEVDRFDAQFFGISPREAAEMDPQQRLVMEVGWEALEHAGIAPLGLAGSDTGVFIGLCTGDYAAQTLEDLPGIQAWTGIGAAACAASNRLSHVLDLRGPSITVDTACSASLVALHLACQSLRAGACSVALAGGVNLILSPGQTITLQAAGALAPDGRSKPFDASADGYGRGEGCGVVVVKRLADAQRDRDQILAVVLGDAVRQDGRTEGIMAPSTDAQVQVMERACAQAGIDPATIDYIEAHGTGTSLGDLREAAALATVYGRRRSSDTPCLIGSVKSNIGHLEGAAGIAGVIKAVLALSRSYIPPTMLATGPHPAIAWNDSHLRIADEGTPWPVGKHPRRAGVSGFGYGGTLSHIILQQPPEPPPTPRPDTRLGVGRARLFALSAASRPALTESAAALARWLTDQGDQAPLASVGHTLAVRRSHLPERATVIAADRSELITRLLDLDGQTTIGSANPAAAGLVWVLPGHGSQWAGMGHDLLTEPAFAEVIDHLDPIYRHEAGFSPRRALSECDLAGTDRVQTLIFAIQTALAALWHSYGVRPTAVIGHSVGEIAAAVICGALTLDDGARLVCRRSRLLRPVTGTGAMFMVTLPFEEVQARLKDRADVVAAIHPSPGTTVVSGHINAVTEVAERWLTEGLAVRWVNADVAFHSPVMDPLLPALIDAAADLTPTRPQIPMYTTALSDPRTMPVPDGSYWAANLRNPVLLSTAVTAAAQDGFREFLEISPHPLLTHSIIETLAQETTQPTYVGATLYRNRPEKAAFLHACATLHCHTDAVDWTLQYPTGDLLALPTYPWQGTRHWHEPSTATLDLRRPGHRPSTHTLLGPRDTIAGSEVQLWRTVLSDANRPYEGSHALHEVEIVPAAVLVETFRQAAADTGQPTDLQDVRMLRPLMTSGRHEIQIVRDGTTLTLASRTSAAAQPPCSAAAANPWLIHAQARISPTHRSTGTSPQQPPSTTQAPLSPADPALIRQRLAAAGVPSTGFDWTIENLSIGAGILHATIQTTHPPTSWAPALDAVTSTAPAAFPGEPVLRMVTSIDTVTTDHQPPDRFIIQIHQRTDRPDTLDAHLTTLDNNTIAHLTGIVYPVVPQQPRQTEPTPDPHQRRLFAHLDSEQLHATILAQITTHIAAEMGLTEDALRPDHPLADQGLDSVMTAGLRHRLEKSFGCPLPITVLWQRPTVNSLAEHFIQLLTQHSAPTTATSSPPPPGTGPAETVR